MPIKIPNNLPAYKTLQEENVFVISELTAARQDIRPLKIIIVNLMPTKIATETQLLRLLSNTPLQVDVTFIRMDTYVAKHESEHLEKFYTTFPDIRNSYFDGMIITGAPVELLSFEEVKYWKELCEMMEWSKSHVFGTIHICWGAQAALHYHYGIEKRELPRKLSGVFPQKISAPCLNMPIVKGFDEVFFAPHSRYTEVLEKDINAHPSLDLIATSELAGAYLIGDKKGRQFFITGHTEYDRETLREEYLRDVGKGLKIGVPHNYFPGDNPENEPPFIWSAHASLLYFNWLNFCIYQRTPYNLEEIEPI